MYYVQCCRRGRQSRFFRAQQLTETASFKMHGFRCTSPNKHGCSNHPCLTHFLIQIIRNNKSFPVQKSMGRDYLLAHIYVAFYLLINILNCKIYLIRLRLWRLIAPVIARQTDSARPGRSYVGMTLNAAPVSLVILCITLFLSNSLVPQHISDSHSNMSSFFPQKCGWMKKSCIEDS